MGQVCQDEVGEKGCAEACCVALRGMRAVARLLQLRCAAGHAVARVLPSGALVVLYRQRGRCASL